ncbi:MAG: hypothetical protein WC002_00085 [Candidatus Muiribacteriota bacterium]
MFIKCLIITLIIVLSGCSQKEEISAPIEFPSKLPIPEPDFISAMETYFLNQQFAGGFSERTEATEVKINNIMSYIRNRNYSKAIEFIEEEQRADSNPYNQLIYHQLRAYSLNQLNQDERFNNEMDSFFILYERLITSYRNK